MVEGARQKRPMETKRYAIRIQPNLEWTIYDVFTGATAKPSSWPLVDLPFEKAFEYCGFLNSIDRFRRSSR
ncbi:hypothetical protein [Shinella sp. YE25]|uniref:hypothetical protein n=2 Tax=Shinella TaxID=323620 RepID=UPI00225C7A3B|nr:hypothetical protein [Shinella sp. YE25]CAI0337279.1 conserved hypothetical protein [Rhizobiaceae bacterium]CAK7255774.1 conserved protein of unknown function [Shinella sp. WSC3-e]